MNLLSKLGRNAHFVASALLGVALFPALSSLKLPTRFDWPTYFVAYWFRLALDSICYAVVLYLIGFPFRETIQPVWRRYRESRRPLLLLVAAWVGFLWLFGPGLGLTLCVSLVAVLELVNRMREQRGELSGVAGAVFIPAAYLFLGLILIFAYNDIIVSLRFYGAFDALLNRMDARIMGGVTVSDMGHWTVRHLPTGILEFLEFVYFGMFTQIGAGIFLTGLAFGRKRAVQFIGAILTGYYLALILFFLWPSHGPYYLSASHFAELPHTLRTYTSQQRLLANAQMFWEHKGKDRIGLDYYIAFPCMHIAQPLIVMWFLRKWKRIVGFLVGVDVLLLAPVLLLEWHYVVDLLGGVVVALLAIGIVDGWGSYPQPTDSPLQS